MEQLPQKFIDTVRVILGTEESEKLVSALAEEPTVSFRVNASKGFVPGSPQDAVPQRVPWSATGYYLNERPAFTFDPLLHAGMYYVQEASSMFLEQVVRRYVTRPAVVLDLCAAPGGKSTHIRSLLPEGSLLVSNEMIRSRSLVLAENLIKWGHPGTVVTNNPPGDFAGLDSLFDVIFADVPCSGEGMFRKDPGAIREWSAENVEICWRRQRTIIGQVWDALRPGGILVYSTCTYNVKENEENIRWIRDTYGAQPLPVDHLPEWGITDQLAAGDFPAYRFFPHKTRGEGFFLAVLQKPAGETITAGTYRSKPDRKQAAVEPVPAGCRTWLDASGDYCFTRNGQVVTALPVYAEEKYRILCQQLKVVHAGIPLAVVKGKDLIPQHPLAMATGLNRDAFPTVEVSYEQAVSYLRTEALRLGAEHPKGYVLLTYRHTPLGFGKNIGNRANNLYPQEWRIRSGYLPAVPANLVSPLFPLR